MEITLWVCDVSGWDQQSGIPASGRRGAAVAGTRQPQCGNHGVGSACQSVPHQPHTRLQCHAHEDLRIYTYWTLTFDLLVSYVGSIHVRYWSVTFDDHCCHTHEYLCAYDVTKAVLMICLSCFFNLRATFLQATWTLNIGPQVVSVVSFPKWALLETCCNI